LASDNPVKILQALSKQPSPGPAPAFSNVHICRALFVIGDEGPIGRIELSRKLELGEGAIRTVIRRLTHSELVSVVRDGCLLTKRGTNLYNRLRTRLSRVAFIDARQLSLDKFSAAISVKKAAGLVRRGLEQRDAAIRAGATGACTLVVKRHRYVMPMAESDEWELQPEDDLVQSLDESIHPRYRDAVVVASAPSKGMAEQGAIAAALTLLE
jgi:predicted transcriptional regulator